MRTFKAKAAIGFAAAAALTGVGLYVGHVAGGGDAVQESATRVSASAPGAAATRASASVPHGLSYVEPMPEPEESALRPKEERKPATLVPAPKSGETRADADFPGAEVVAAPPVARGSGGGDCKTGARPMGDCNCYDEAAGKVTLTLHPSNACIEAESKRLGHKVIVQDESGKLELAGTYPERPAETEAKPAPQAKLAAAAQPEVSSEALAEMLRANSIPHPSTYFPPEVPQAIPMPAPAKSQGVLARQHSRRTMPSVVHPAHSAFAQFRPVPMPVITNLGNPKSPSAPAYQGLMQGEQPILVMSKCGIYGHSVHLKVGSGPTLHVRQTTQLTGMLAHLRDIVVTGKHVTVFSKKIVIWNVGVNDVGQEVLSAPYVAENYAAMPGFEDGGAANAYANSLYLQAAGSQAAPSPNPINKTGGTTKVVLGKK